MFRRPAVLLLLLVIGCHSTPTSNSSRGTRSGPWNLTELEQPPAITWGGKTGLVQELYYAGQPLSEKPTRVFAYLGRPTQGTGPFPAVVLVHGGGGKAF